jgi:photosystem II stability/assembly factor-like uncharacterized protein
MKPQRLVSPGAVLPILLIGVFLTHAATPWRLSTMRSDGGGWVTGMVCHPAEEGLRYIRTDIGGAYRWSIPEQKWISIHNWVPYGKIGLGNVDAIAIDPKDTDVVYIAAGWWNSYGGVYKSTNRGKTFTQLGFPHPEAINGNDGGGGGPGKRTRGERLEVSPFDSQEMIFGIIQSIGGLFKTTDGGQNWTRLDLPGLSNGDEIVLAVLYDRFNEGHFYANVNQKGLYRTTNGGSSFSKVNCPANDIRRLEQASDGTIYFTNENPGQGLVFKMVDGNATDITNGMANAGNDRHTWVSKKGVHGIAVNPADPQHLLVEATLSSWRVGTPIPIYETQDGGQNWRRMNIHYRTGPAWTSLKDLWKGVQDSLPLEMLLQTVTDLVWDPHQHNTVYHMDGGGVATLELSNDTIHADQTAYGIEETVNFCLLSVPLDGKEHLLGGCADRGGYFYGTREQIDEQPEIQLAVKDKLQSVHGIGFCWAQPTRLYFVGRDNDDRVTGNIARYCYRSDDGGQTWEETGYPGGVYPQFVAVSSTDPDNLVVQGDSYAVSFDGGKSWQSCSGISGTGGSHNWLWVKWVTADPVDGSTFYAYEEKGVVKRSTNGGKNFTTVSSNLPQLSIHRGGKKLSATPGKKGHLWLNCHEEGLWHSSDGGESWSEIPGFTNDVGAIMADVGVAPEGNAYPGAVFVIGQYNGEGGLWVSLDEGSTWDRISADNVFLSYALTFEASNYEYGLVMCGGNGEGAWYLMKDDGTGVLPGAARAQQPRQSKVGTWTLYNARGQAVTTGAGAARTKAAGLYFSKELQEGKARPKALLNAK